MLDQDFALLPELLLLGRQHLLSGLNTRDQLLAFSFTVFVFEDDVGERVLHHIDLTRLIELCQQLVPVELQLFLFASKDFLPFNDFLLFVVEIALAKFDLTLAEQHFTAQRVQR